MFRGSSYSIQTDKDILNQSQLLEQQVRMAMVGISEVGKSSMLSCMENEPFNEDIPNTRGVQIRFKKLRINHHAVNLYVWDGPGDRMFQFLDEGQFSTTDAILYVFDLTDRQSFSQLQQLYQQMLKHYPRKMSSVLVGNKADLLGLGGAMGADNQSNYLAERFAKREDMLYMKVSAKRNSSIKDAYIELIKQVLKKRHQGKTSRIFSLQEEISRGGKSQEVSANGQNWCSCCKSMGGSCNIF